MQDHSPGEEAADTAFCGVQSPRRVLQAGATAGSGITSYQEEHVSTSGASSSRDREADSLCREARVVVIILMARI